MAVLMKAARSVEGTLANANIHLVSAASAVKSEPLITPIFSKKVLVW
jgi:hypothetical protein